ncbi:MAG TPA: hypothetical protein VHN98_04610 [Acidimicrobiales bacterium]|nr:hypothetical protein [Acidimicrobiales bacterium]
MAVGLLASACAVKGATVAAAPGGQPTTTTTSRPMKLVGGMTVDPAKGPAGTAVKVHGHDLPASAPLELVWTTHECRWVLAGDQHEEYHGRKCDAKDVELAPLTTGADGTVDASFVAPDDFGFAHDVLLLDKAGVVVNKALFDEAIQVAIAPDRGPVGTPITVSVKGMGVDALENNRQILYDNVYTGWVSAITTRGSATAVIPATGRPGTHVVQVARGAFTFPYLNPAQSPRPDIPVFSFTFTVTDGAPVLPAALADQSPRPTPAKASAVDGPSIAADVATTPVGSQVTVTGRGLPASADVKLQWFRIVGNRVAGQGWEEKSIDLPAAKTTSAGTFESSFPAPGDVGGPHRIEATVAGANAVDTTVSITPSVLSISPASGPAGSTFTIALNGVGWTETANIYTVVYDNAYVGYVCGFNSQGNVTLPMVAAGAPGWHFVDLYPAIYKGEETGGQQSFRIPQLTFTDHPGEKLPVFHFAFQVTG